MNMNQPKIAIIGLGYVGLPLARLFATKYAVVGFDINTERVHELRAGKDTTLEVEDEVLKSVLVYNSSDAVGLYCSTLITDIKDCNYYIITVPTPVDKNNRPVLTPLLKASETVGSVLKKDDIVVYESLYTREQQKKIVYPYWRKFQDWYLIKISMQAIHLRELILEINYTPLIKF